MRIGIIAGRGDLPHLTANACEAQCIPFCWVDISGGENKPPEDVPSTKAGLGSVGSVIEFLKGQYVTHVIMAGGINRPKLSSLKMDSKGMQWMARLGLKAFQGDDALLKGVSALFHEEGFEIMSPNELLQLTPNQTGVLSARQPTPAEWEDIERGRRILETLSPWDIGQSLIIYSSYVLGIEAAEGTSKLIERCEALRQEAAGGILIKMAKQGQSLAVDAPTIGPDTIQELHKGHFEGLAICSQTTQILHQAEVIALINKYNLFMVSF
jgi:DUF1009 family protein